MQGLDKFREYMSGFRSHYVVIGGMATVLTLEDRGLPARATKDVDMIIICQPESKFYMKRFWLSFRLTSHAFSSAKIGRILENCKNLPVFLYV